MKKNKIPVTKVEHREKIEKMYLIIDKDGHYFSDRDNKFYFNLGNASWAASEAQVRGMMKKIKDVEVDVKTCTEDDFWHAKAVLLTEVLIIGELLLSKLTNDLKTSLPHLKTNKGLRSNLDKLIKDLKPIKLEFEYFYNTREDDILDLQGDLASFIYFISHQCLGDMEKFSEIAEAYHKKPSAVMGIVKKINSEK